MIDDAELERALTLRTTDSAAESATESAVEAALRVAGERERFPTEALFARALERCRAHWNEQDLEGRDLDVGAELVVLHHRPDTDVVERGAALLRSDDERERYVGLRVLREIGDVRNGEYPARVRVRTLLEAHARDEAHPALRALAVAGACQQAFEERADFLGQALDDPEPGVRMAAADGLLNALSFEAPTDALLARLEPLVRRALADDRSDVRWSVVWDIAEHGVLARLSDAARGDLERLRDDPDPLIREDVAELLDGASDDAE